MHHDPAVVAAQPSGRARRNPEIEESFQILEDKLSPIIKAGMLKYGTYVMGDALMTWLVFTLCLRYDCNEDLIIEFFRKSMEFLPVAIDDMREAIEEAKKH